MKKADDGIRKSVLLYLPAAHCKTLWSVCKDPVATDLGKGRELGPSKEAGNRL